MKHSKTQKSTTLLSTKLFTAMEYSKTSQQFSLYFVSHGENADFFLIITLR